MSNNDKKLYDIKIINRLFSEFTEKIGGYTIPSQILETIVNNERWNYSQVPSGIIDMRFTWNANVYFSYIDFWRLQTVFIIFVLYKNITFINLYSNTNAIYLEKLFLEYNAAGDKLTIMKYKLFVHFKIFFIKKRIWSKEKIKRIEEILLKRYCDCLNKKDGY